MTSTSTTKTAEKQAIELAKQLKKAVVIGEYIHDYSQWPHGVTSTHVKFDEIFNNK